MKYFVGCSGWSKYQACAKDFYPATLDSKDYLTHYSKVFDFVEVNLATTFSSSYSRFPQESILRKWAKETSDNFRFTFKIQIIDDNNDIDEIGFFLERVHTQLEGKILAFNHQQN